MAKVEEKVENIVKEPIEKLGYELYDVMYIKEGKNYTLRIVIDKEDGIDLEDCEKVNNAITDLLDDEDLIKEQYFLEVSSPGIERILRKDWQLKKFIGSNVDVNMFKKDENNKKEYIGILKEVSEDELILEIETEENIKIDRKNISQVKTVYEF